MASAIIMKTRWARKCRSLILDKEWARLIYISGKMFLEKFIHTYSSINMH